MEGVFAAYATAGAGVSLAEFDSERDGITPTVFMALLSDLGCTGAVQDAVLRGGAYEVRARRVGILHTLLNGVDAGSRWTQTS